MNRRLFLIAAWALLALSLPARAEPSVIYEGASRYNGAIVVTEEPDGMRTLRFARGGTRQSVVKPGDPAHLEMPYAQVALAGLALCGEPRRILVVGLGGGMLTGFLRKHYPDARIDAVEIDPAVVEAAKRYFGFREDPLMRAHVADGREFIERVREPYDVILLDAFGEYRIPERLTTREFLSAVRRALAPGGVAIGNLWRSAENPAYDAMVRTYEDAFDQVLLLDVEGYANQILLALPRPEAMSRGELAQRARHLSAAKGLRFDLGELVDTGWTQARRRSRAARPLRDADFD